MFLDKKILNHNSVNSSKLIYTFNAMSIKASQQLFSRDLKSCFKNVCGDFPGGTVVKNLPANAGDRGSSPGPGRSHMPRSN